MLCLAVKLDLIRGIFSFYRVKFKLSCFELSKQVAPKLECGLEYPGSHVKTYTAEFLVINSRIGPRICIYMFPGEAGTNLFTRHSRQRACGSLYFSEAHEKHFFKFIFFNFSFCIGEWLINNTVKFQVSREGTQPNMYIHSPPNSTLKIKRK